MERICRIFESNICSSEYHLQDFEMFNVFYVFKRFRNIFCGMKWFMIWRFEILNWFFTTLHFTEGGSNQNLLVDLPEKDIKVNNMVLKIYGAPASQPCRAVMWVLHYKKLEYELIKAIPATPADKKYSCNNEFYQKLSKGRKQIPIMDDDGLIIGESHAILTYLCQKHGWTDLYPEDLRGNLWFTYQTRYSLLESY